MSKFIQISNHSIERSDIIRLGIRDIDDDRFKCQLVVYLKSASSPSKNVYINFVTKEQAQEEHDRVNGMLNDEPTSPNYPMGFHS